MTLRWCRLSATSDDPAGFTVIEMVVAMSLLSAILLSAASVLYGGMGALVSSRQRSAFVEIANAEMEKLRATPYLSVGVNTGDTATYQGSPPTFEGRDAVVVASGAPPAVSTVTSSPVRGIVLPYTVRRWVTWTDTSGGGSHKLKRLVVEAEWTENNRAQRKLRLSSLLYHEAVSSNRPPVAVMAPPTPASGPLVTPFAFDGSGSNDPDNDAIVSYAWNFGDSSTGAGATASHVYANPGCYTVTLAVTDANQQSSAPVSRNVSVSSATNTAPAAALTFGPATGTAPLAANFSSTSTDDGCIASWDWDWGDGTAHGTTEQANHVFESAGTFSVTLTVTDAGGLSSSATASIQVNPLDCDATSGSFKNPGTNAVANDVLVTRNNKPVSTSFTFTATTNDACTSVTAQLPHQGGVLTVNLAVQSSAGGTKTWTGTAAVLGSDRFNVGSSQTATMRASGVLTNDNLTYPFDVHA
ncbi:MAG: PKD domain-containing protein [Actinomycetota bacterium]|nr:PKD domain-containing protein [Actinomycetota bacterium]MDQ3680731.1 PKD domain-containing protein [Actinomycetota bacterium]